MPRSAQFDRSQALNAALKLFWARGYSATALPDLLQAMGIARSSFYASFGSKRELFIECLELFGERTLQGIAAREDSLPPGQLPRAFFENTLLEPSRQRVAQGCMMVNSVLELSEVDAELSEFAASRLDLIESFFARCFTDAQTSGALDSQRSPKELAQLVMTINLGLRVQSRKNPSREYLQSIVDSSLDLLGLTA
ncbi:MAG: TetR/AcrR family transcriptional regulator [Pseudomonadota bacterium]